MNIINQSQAIALILWAETIGKCNWGSWGQYPCPGTYLSFDTSHIRFEPANRTDFGGVKFVATNRNCPGKGEVITLYALTELVDSEALDVARKEAYNKAYQAVIDQAQDAVNTCEHLSNYDVQEAQVREQLQRELNSVVINKVFGNPIPVAIDKYVLKISNYCHTEVAEITCLSLELISRNARKTAGTYKVTNMDNWVLEEIVKRFTNERVEAYKALTELHRTNLSKILQS